MPTEPEPAIPAPPAFMPIQFAHQDIDRTRWRRVFHATMDRLIAEHFVKHDRSTMELIEEFQPHVATAVSVGLTFMGQRTTQAAVNKVYDALEGLIGAAL